MKTLSLSTKFYIIFFLFLTTPASWVASKIETCIGYLPPANFFHELATAGVFDTPTTVGVLLLFFWLFDRYIWRFYPLKKIMGVLDINGRYEGQLFSAYAENKEQNGTYPVAIEITQTLTSLRVCLYTERSCSYGLIANLCTNEKGNHELVYVYQNKTFAMDFDTDMRNHHGTAFLEIFEDGKTLIGNYFNNPRERGRYGRIEVSYKNGTLKGKY